MINLNPIPVFEQELKFNSARDPTLDAFCRISCLEDSSCQLEVRKNTLTIATTRCFGHCKPAAWNLRKVMDKVQQVFNDIETHFEQCAPAQLYEVEYTL